jgi:hypothetical protein
MPISRSVLCSAAAGLLALAPLPAHSRPAEAVGISLSWNACSDDAGAAGDLRFACDTNDRGGPFRLVASIVPDATIPGIIGVETVFLVDYAGQLPDWWTIDVGGCRIGSVVQEAPLATTVRGTCHTWLGAGFSFGFSSASLTSQGLVITTEWDNPGGVTSSVLAGQRYVASILDIDQQHTVASAPADVACAGCATPTQISLGWVRLIRATDSWAYLLPSGSKTVTWQGPSVPTRNSSWGAIKALYR